jgi:hypothetical protein
MTGVNVESTTDVTDDFVSGNNTRKLTNFNHQGIINLVQKF